MAKVAGSIWVEGNDLHYIDQFNREWYSPGFFIKNVSAGPKPGSLWQDSGTTAGIYWVNEAGNAIYRTPVNFVKFIANTYPITSLYVSSDNFLTWLWYYDGTRHQVLNNHWDVATVSTHTDTHSDGAHIDTHTDIPHTDQPTSHADYHQDYPHGDFWDNVHGDFWDVAVPHDDYIEHSDIYSVQLFGDNSPDPDRLYTHNDGVSNPSHIFHSDYYHDDRVDDDHWGTWLLQHHEDFNQHIDGAATYNHTDYHNDSPHQDYATGYYHDDFYTTHQDAPHQDVPHQDASHQDSHADTHGDTPHTDQPVYIGP